MADLRLVILGAAGAGKGTQCERLVDGFDLAHVTTGDALRANEDMETEYGTPRSYIGEGELVQDPAVNRSSKQSWRVLMDSSSRAIHGTTIRQSISTRSPTSMGYST